MRRAGTGWMACYAMLGFVQSGLVPIILPLGSPPGPTAGFTYAAYAAAGMTAPLVGAWSDRHRCHRLTLAGGLALAGLALLLHFAADDVALRMVFAALLGLGCSTASTVGTMFIVEVAPQAAWDGQIGRLQACIGGGQLCGLLVAGWLGLRHVDAGYALGAALVLAAVPLAWLLAPDPVVKVERPLLASRPARGGDAVPAGPQRSMHGLTRRGLASLGHNGLAWFLAAWLVSYTATNGLSVMFSVAMVRNYHVPATWPTTAYAIGVGLSLVLYRVVGGWDTRFGPWRVLSTAIFLRGLAVAAMLALTASHADAAALPLLLCFGVTQVLWPMLSVASNTLAVTLAPGRRAESVGLLNAATSVGATLGGMVGGVLLRDGFDWLCAAVLLALAVALLLAWHPKVRIDAPA